MADNIFNVRLGFDLVTKNLVECFTLVQKVYVPKFSIDSLIISISL